MELLGVLATGGGGGSNQSRQAASFLGGAAAWGSSKALSNVIWGLDIHVCSLSCRRERLSNLSSSVLDEPLHVIT